MKTLANILKVVASNITTIISGVFVGFLLPKVISVSDYGFYKIFSLYFNYLGVLSLGIIDGIVLKYGAKEYSELDRERFRSYFAWYSILHLCLTIIIAASAIFTDNVDYKFIIILLAVNLFPANATGYLQQISQITQRFKEYSLRKILQSVANVLLVVLLFVLYKSESAAVNYQSYLIGLLLINVLLVAWYLVTYRDIIFGRRKKLTETFVEVISLSKLGIPLLLANMCSTLFMSLDRQFVSVLFETEQYALYAFAYSILSLITVATSAISVVIYPFFKRIEQDLLKKNYQYISSILLIFVFLVILVYYPLAYFIEWFLPQYTYSISIFGIVLPGLAMSTSVTVVMHNYYKVFGKSADFFKKSVLVLALSFTFNVIAYTIFGTMESISAASILALLGWYLISDAGLRKVCERNYKPTIYMVIMCIAFYLSIAINVYWVGALVYLSMFLTMTALFFFKDYKMIKGILKPGTF